MATTDKSKRYGLELTLAQLKACRRALEYYELERSQYDRVPGPQFTNARIAIVEVIESIEG